MVPGLIPPRSLSGLLLCLLLMALPALAEPPAQYEDFAELDLESLLDQTITSATKYEQKVSESPVAATVITADEIAARGARSIPELLRDVPGLGVIQTGSSSFDVSARGMTEVGANTFLVMVDGRKVYLDLYSITLWDQLPVSIEDIKAIEIILGPGSVMYGANAFAGVINIITFTAEEKPGTTARLLASDVGSSYGSLRHAGSAGKNSYKLTTTWDRSEDWETRTRETEVARFEGTLSRKLGQDTRISASLGHINALSMLIASDTHLANDGHQSHGRIDLQSGQLEARFYTNKLESTLLPITYALTRDAVLKSRTHDLEVRHSVFVNGGHHLIYGGSYRHQRTSYSQQEGQFKTDTYAGFLHDEWRLNDKLAVSLGARYDNHPLVGGHWSPRGGLVYLPHPEHTLRFTYGKAYRDPAFLETHWWTEVESVPGLTQIIRGDPANDSETIEAFEIGYQGLPAENLLCRLALFRNHMENLIDMGVTSYFPPPAPPGIPMEMVFMNMHSWLARGGEFSLWYDATDRIRLGVSYAYVWLEDHDTGVHLPQVSVHRAGLMASLDPGNGHRVDLIGRFTSDALEHVGTAQEFDPYVNEHFEVDAIWNLKRSSGSRLTVGAYNLLDRRTRDYPLAIERRRSLRMSVIQEF